MAIYYPNLPRTRNHPKWGVWGNCAVVESELLRGKEFKFFLLERAGATEESKLAIRWTLSKLIFLGFKRKRAHEICNLEELIVMRTDTLRKLNLTSYIRKALMQEVRHRRLTTIIIHFQTSKRRQSGPAWKTNAS